MSVLCLWKERPECEIASEWTSEQERNRNKNHCRNISTSLSFHWFNSLVFSFPPIQGFFHDILNGIARLFVLARSVHFPSQYTMCWNKPWPKLEMIIQCPKPDSFFFLFRSLPMWLGRILLFSPFGCLAVFVSSMFFSVICCFGFFYTLQIKYIKMQ